MNLLHKIARNIASAPKKLKAVVALAAVLATVSGVVYAGWTPDRPTFDWNNVADRKGSQTGPVFNSFINTPFYGDERAFLDARMTDKNDVKDVLPYVTNGSREVILRTYIHNNGNQDLNASGVSVAKDTKVRIVLPTGTSTALRARSYITSSNATPTEISDTAELVDATPFSISYIPGSAKIYNSAHASGLSLGDAIVTTGDLIGYDKMDGTYPGCFDFQSFVEVHIKVNVPSVSIVKQVKGAADSAWQKETIAKPGDTVRWLVSVKNTGNETLDDVTVSDALPAHFKVVPGTVKRTDGANKGVAQNDTSLFTDKGINFTSYGTQAALYVGFDTIVQDDLGSTCEARMQNQAFVSSKQTPTEKKDTADVVIKKENCKPVITPVVTCDALTAPKLALKTGESTVFTATGTATNTTITGYTFKVNGQVVQDTAANTYTFVQTAEGSYTVDVTVKSATGNAAVNPACAKTVTVQKEVTPVYTCDALTFNKTTLLTGENLTTSVKYTATGGATFSGATFKFGDNAQFTTNNSTNGVVTAEHSYGAKGNYAITVKLDFSVNGQPKSVEGGNCVGQVNITPEKCVIPGKEQFEKNDKVNCNAVKGVTTIADTGAGDMIGIFAAVTAAGAFMHSMIMRRSMNR